MKTHGSLKRQKLACINLICYPSNRIMAWTRKQYETKKWQRIKPTWSEWRRGLVGKNYIENDVYSMTKMVCNGNGNCTITASGQWAHTCTHQCRQRVWLHVILYRAQRIAYWTLILLLLLCFLRKLTILFYFHRLYFRFFFHFHFHVVPCTALFSAVSHLFFAVHFFSSRYNRAEHRYTYTKRQQCTYPCALLLLSTQHKTAPM